MMKNSLKVQILGSVLTILVIGMGVIFYLSYNNLKLKVNNSQLDVYNQKLNNIILLIEQKYNVLQKIGMTEAYDENFKKGTVKIINKVFLNKSNEVHLFIINEDRKFILPKNLIQKEQTIYKNKDFLKKVEKQNNNFIMVLEDSEEWIIFKHFMPWDWIVGYYISNDVKYKELHEFKNEFIITSLIILLIISFFIIAIVRYILTPIIKLTDASKEIASGNLDFGINITGSNEINQLASNFIIMRDKIKKNMKQLNHYNEELQKDVDERTTELEESYNELEKMVKSLRQTRDKLVESEKMASLGGLVAGVAHEINTPIGIGLTGITYFLQITDELHKKYETDNMSEEEFVEYLNESKELAQQINTNLERTAQLIRSFKQIAADQTSEKKRTFYLKDYIEEVLFSLKHITKKTNLEIKINCNDNIKINSYPGAYSQIITNLLLNSIRHGYKNNAEGIITIAATKIYNNIELIYKDNGMGIAEKNLPNIFEPFFTTNREQGGIGLGLNIIYNIVTSNLNGTITCDSQYGNGVIFSINIPTEVD